MSLLWATAATNVTNASFKSSPVPLQTTLLAYEPAEGDNKETAAAVHGITGQPVHSQEQKKVCQRSTMKEDDSCLLVYILIS